MIRKQQTTMFSGDPETRRPSLVWDSQIQRERNEGRYVRKRSASPYHTSRWTRLAKSFLSTHPLCAECARKGMVKAAECVDHVVPWPICEDYFFDTRNLQSLCSRCNIEKGNHDKKQIAEWRKSHRRGGADNRSEDSLRDLTPKKSHENPEKQETGNRPKITIYGRKW